MGSDSSLPILAPLGAPNSSQIHTTLSIDGSADVNNMKIPNPHDCSIPLAIADQTPHPRTSSLQADDPTMLEDKSTLKTHAYSRVGVIKPGTYSSSLLKSALRPKGQKFDCAGCTAVHSLGIDHCHKHDGDKNGKGPHKRLHR